jgi:hemerythrin-like domain-containing protein
MGNTPIYSHRFLYDLVSEHRLYEYLWGRFWKIYDRAPDFDLQIWEQLKAMVVWTDIFLHKLHCRKEETLLFAELLKHRKLSEGGPMCSLYFDTFINNNPLRRVQKSIDTEDEIHPTPEQQVYFKQNSPLTVPLQDHIAGQKLVEYILKLLQNDPSEKDYSLILPLLRLHNEIERQHFQKEETCLFIVAGRLIHFEGMEDLQQASSKVISPIELIAAQEVLTALGVWQ